jgi:hypothetical protein
MGLVRRDVRGFFVLEMGQGIFIFHLKQSPMAPSPFEDNILEVIRTYCMGKFGSGLLVDDRFFYHGPVISIQNVLACQNTQ